jgi:hypothetical protein
MSFFDVPGRARLPVSALFPDSALSALTALTAQSKGLSGPQHKRVLYYLLGVLRVARAQPPGGALTGVHQPHSLIGSHQTVVDGTSLVRSCFAIFCSVLLS